MPLRHFPLLDPARFIGGSGVLDKATNGLALGSVKACFLHSFLPEAQGDLRHSDGAGSAHDIQGDDVLVGVTAGVVEDFRQDIEEGGAFYELNSI